MTSHPRTCRCPAFHNLCLLLVAVWTASLPGCVAEKEPPEPGGNLFADAPGHAALPAALEVATGEYVPFPAIGVELVRPEGFEVQEDFHGFGQQESQSSIMLLTLPGPFSEVSSGFTAERLAPRGMTLVGRQPHAVGDQPGLFVTFTQSAGGTVYEKCSLIFGDEHETTMVTATCPRERAAEFSARLQASVLSTRPIDVERPAPGEDVDFRVDSSRLKLTRGIPKMLMYTKDGVLPAKAPGDPLFAVAPSVSPVPVADRKQFALDRLRQTAQTTIRTVRSHEPVTIDGLDGYETLAEASDTGSGTPLAVYQVILFDNGRYLLMQGLVGEALAAEYVPEFKAMAASFRKGRD